MSKVIGDFHDNYAHGPPSELALITLYRSDTGAPFAIVDGTLMLPFYAHPQDM